MYKEKFGEPASSAVLTHLKTELIQAVWRLLLDDEFKEAYQLVMSGSGRAGFFGLGPGFGGSGFDKV